MCLILFLYRRHPRYPLVLAANRDEFYARPTRPLAFWPDAPQVLAGRDLAGGGTWLGVTRTGRLAAVTNYRNPSQMRAEAPSRGELVSGFLGDTAPPASCLAQLERRAARYNGFNLLAGDADGLYYCSNRGRPVERLTPGCFGLSNHLLDTPWPKVARGKEGLGDLLATDAPIDPEALFALLADTRIPADAHLPDTGVGLAWERRLGPLFITSETYGTRSSSLLLIAKTGKLSFFERSFPSDPHRRERPRTRRFAFKLPAGRRWA